MKFPAKGSLLREIPLLVTVSLIISIVIKAFLVQAFYIPSGSMEQTLKINDRVVVNKLGNFFTEVKRGDVLVFRDPGGWLPESLPENHSTAVRIIRSGLVFVGLLPDPAKQHLIKRVIGVAGDEVVCCTDKKLSINGVVIKENYLYPGNNPSELEFRVTVPKGFVWAMGDHRAASEDSRYHQEDPRKGMVPLSAVVGRAVAIVWPPSNAGFLPKPDVLKNIPVREPKSNNKPAIK